MDRPVYLAELQGKLCQRFQEIPVSGREAQTGFEDPERVVPPPRLPQQFSEAVIIFRVVRHAAEAVDVGQLAEDVAVVRLRFQGGAELAERVFQATLLHEAVGKAKAGARRQRIDLLVARRSRRTPDPGAGDAVETRGGV